MLDSTIESFLDRLASSDPTPGGGSAGAVIAAMGAALVSMVANLTVGKEKFAAVEADMRATLEGAEALRGRLQAMVAEDIQVFGALMAAYKLPKETDADKAARSAAIQSSLRQSTEVPIECARACVDVIRLALVAGEKGNGMVVSDAGVAALAAQAALRSSALAVYINVPSIKDAAFATQARADIEALLAEGVPLADRVYEVVKARL